MAARRSGPSILFSSVLYGRSRSEYQRPCRSRTSRSLVLTVSISSSGANSASTWQASRITERMSPLLGVNFRTQGNLSGRVEYRTDPDWFNDYQRRETVEWTPPQSLRKSA
mgnify:CR=1 FL=1